MNGKIQLLLAFCCFLAVNAQYGRGGYGRGFGGGRFYGGRRGYPYGGPDYGYGPEFVPGVGVDGPGVVGVDAATGVVATDGTPGLVPTDDGLGVVEEFVPGFRRGYGPDGFNPGFNRGYGPGFNRGYGPGFNRGYNPVYRGTGAGGTVANAGGIGTGVAAGSGGATVAKTPEEAVAGAGGAVEKSAAEHDFVGKLDARKLKRNEVVSGLVGSDTVPIKDIFLGGVDDRVVELLPSERYRE